MANKPDIKPAPKQGMMNKAKAEIPHTRTSAHVAKASVGALQMGAAVAELHKQHPKG